MMNTTNQILVESNAIWNQVQTWFSITHQIGNAASLKTYLKIGKI